MISDEQLAWLAISQCPGIGVKRFDQLFAYLQSVDLTPLQFWQLSSNEVHELAIWPAVKKAIQSHKYNFSIEKVRNELEKNKVCVLIKGSDNYPELLKQISNAPPVLFVQGFLKPKYSLPIAVVGTRKVSSYGRMVTKLLTKELVKHGAEVISGFMYGVDTIAHQTAIEQNGYTIAVLGYGFDFSYPASHAKLKKAVLDSNGALVSEYLPSTPPIPGQFPQRNRIVAGMSRGILVTEAAVNSGSKITANLAAEYGRDVFAVPGPITSPYSEGTKDLVNNGAKLVSNVKDILEEYETQLSCEFKTVGLKQILDLAENEVEKKLLELLSQQSLTSDDIAVELEINSSELLVSLSLLEMRGVVQLERGKYFVRF